MPSSLISLRILHKLVLDTLASCTVISILRCDLSYLLGLPTSSRYYGCHYMLCNFCMSADCAWEFFSHLLLPIEWFHQCLSLVLWDAPFWARSLCKDWAFDPLCIVYPLDPIFDPFRIAPFVDAIHRPDSCFYTRITVSCHSNENSSKNLVGTILVPVCWRMLGPRLQAGIWILIPIHF